MKDYIGQGVEGEADALASDVPPVRRPQIVREVRKVSDTKVLCEN